MKIRYKSLSLRIGMKGVMTKVAALLLIVWYSMSIIGFGVHTCSGSGKSFIVTFVEGFACEDVHPEHHCSKGSCCSHSHCDSDSDNHSCVKSKSCCSSDYQVLALTGTVSDEKNGNEADRSFVYSWCADSGVAGICADEIYPQVVSENHGYLSRCGRICDRQAVLNVWRI